MGLKPRSLSSWIENILLQSIKAISSDIATLSNAHIYESNDSYEQKSYIMRICIDKFTEQLQHRLLKDESKRTQLMLASLQVEEEFMNTAIDLPSSSAETLVDTSEDHTSKKRSLDYESSQDSQFIPMKRPKHNTPLFQSIADYGTCYDKITFFDLETTGLDTSKDQIVQIAIISYSFLTQSVEEFTSYVKPHLDTIMHRKAEQTHGISMPMLNDAPCFSDVFPKISHLFDKSLICGYNIETFDIPLLDQEILRYHLKSYKLDAYLDLYQVFREIGSKKKGHTLFQCYKHLCGKDLANAHDALSDTKACYDILLNMLEDTMWTKEIKRHWHVS